MDAIVVGYDGSPAAERALERVAALSGDRARVVIVTATVTLPGSIVDEPVAGGPPPAERDALLERAAGTLRSRGIDPVLVAAEDGPAVGLLAAARDHDAALIVVGSKGSDYATRAIVGSTAEAIVRQAPCDVLVVR